MIDATEYSENVHYRRFTVRIDKKGAQEALHLLNRTLNTLEPHFWPEWVEPLLTTLQEIANEGI